MDYSAAAIRFGRLARHLIPRQNDDAKCHPSPDIDLCEKPASSSKATPITIGITLAIVVFGTLGVLTFLHLRRKRRDEAEWPKSQQELEDYGFGSASTSVRQPPTVYSQKNQFERNNDPRFASQQRQQPSRDNYGRSPGGNTTGAFNRHEEQISADMKPMEPLDRL